MQITLNISDDLPLERIKQIILELETRLKTPLHLIEDKSLTIKKKYTPQFGSANGLIKMSADFDEPLDDFVDYMP